MITIEPCLPDESMPCGQLDCHSEARWRITSPNSPVNRRCSAHVMPLVVLELAVLEEQG